ncbi:MAG: GrpB family protein [Proteobacteria bacterium]|nr:GrpB family protein [Pseudomonadota bacterium]
MKFYPAEKYQSKCEKLYQRYKKIISNILPNAQIEHIGSSAIPNCISKGDLDIYVSVKKTEHEHTIKQLEGIEFTVKQDTLRTDELCMLEDAKVAIQLIP